MNFIMTDIEIVLYSAIIGILFTIFFIFCISIHEKRSEYKNRLNKIADHYNYDIVSFDYFQKIFKEHSSNVFLDRLIDEIYIMDKEHGIKIRIEPNYITINGNCLFFTYDGYWKYKKWYKKYYNELVHKQREERMTSHMFDYLITK